MSDDQAFRDFLLADKSASRNADPALVPGRVNARVGVTAQPDAQAQFGDLAKRYGVPAAVVENDPEVWKQRAAADEAQQHIDASPKLGQWLGEDPQRAKVSHDSLEAMAGVDHAFSAVFPKNGSDADKLRYWQAVGQRAPLQIKAAPSAASVAISKVRNFGLTLTAGIDSTFAGLDALAAAGFKSVGLDRAAAASKNDAKLGMTRARSNSRAGWGGTLEGGFYQAVESLPVSLGALALGATTGPQSGLAFVGAVSGGQSYLKAQEAGLGHWQSVGFGALDAAVEVGTEAIPLTRFLQNTAVGTSIGKRLLENVVEENVGEQVATALQDLNQWAQIDSNKGKTFADYLAERPDAALQTAIATTMSVGIINASVTAGEFAARRSERKQQQAANAQRAEVLLTGLKELAEAAPVAQRDVSTFENWVRSAAEGTEATDVYIDAQTLVQTLQQSGLTEPEIIAALPSLQTELPTALIANGDVRIPIEEFAARSGELGASLIPHLRLDPNDMSTSEAQTFMQSAQEEFQKETDKAFDEINADDQFRQSTERVADTVYEKLNAAGRFTPDTNRAYASLHAAFFARLASDLGTTPEEAAARYPLLIQSEGVGEGPGVMDQPFKEGQLLHGTTRDAAKQIAERGVEPRIGDFIRQFYDIEADDPGAFFAHPENIKGAVAAMSAGVARKLNKSQYEVTINDIREHGAIAVATPDPDTTFQLNEDGTSTALAGWGTFDEPPIGAETGDFYSRYTQRVHALIEGDALVSLVEEHFTPREGYDQSGQPLPATIEVDGKQRSTVNSNGQPLAATEEGVRAFWEWFGDSKVVDGQGRPLVVYHGTAADFEAFDPSTIGSKTDAGWAGHGFYFSSDPTVSSAYGGKTVSAYLSAKNLYKFEGNFAKEVAAKGGPRGFSDWLRDNGYDGARLWSQVMVLDPTQIKSIHNRGTFDPNDPRILYQSGQPLPATIEVDGKQRSTVNSNGQPLAQTEEGVRAFWEWFGDSKVVDEQGRPLVVYHGTAALEGEPIAAFQKHKRGASTGRGAELGFYFSKHENHSRFFASLALKNIKGDWTNHYPRIEQVHLSIRNPLVVPSSKEIATLEKTTSESALKAQGYDGVMTENGDEIIAFDPTQIKSIYNRGTFDPNDPRILYQNGQPIFYSALQRTVESSKQAKAPASQWKSILQNAPGVKAEELEWSGILDLLDTDPKAVVTRDQLAALLEGGGIQIEEVELGGENLGDEQSWIESRTDDILANSEYDPEDDMERDEAWDRARDQAEQEWAELAPGATQFKDWSSDPSNDTYRELLLKLPKGKGRNPTEAPSTHWDEQAVVAHARFMEKRDASGDRVLFIEEVQSDWHQKGRDQGYNKRVTDNERADLMDAHRRAQDELRLQNDAVVAVARETGLMPERHMGLPVEQLYGAGLADAAYRGIVGVPQNVSAEADATAAAFAAARLREQETRLALGALSAGIPNAPFKSTWPALVMKRMIRWAVDNGYTKIAWTTGEEQADRYDLAATVGTISAWRNGDEVGVELGNYEAQTAFVGQAGSGPYSREQLVEVLGQDLGNRVFDAGISATYTEAAELEGDDLKIGGEGMKAFYDRNLVNITNDLIKKYGVKVGKIGVIGNTEVDKATRGRAFWEQQLTREDFTDEDRAHAQSALDRENAILSGDAKPGFEINDKLAEAAAGGFPLFQRKGSPRGQAAFASDITSTPSIITLLRGADLSTFLHESGHFFFEVMLHVAAQPDAPQRVVDDMNAFLKWTGVESMGQWSKMSTSEKREHHERFARGFEAYLYEGKAPSLEIKSLFQRFRSWLLTVYRSLKELNVDLTPEVRSIFDRMLASDAQIREAEQQVGYEPILTEKPEGMDEGDWEAYQRLGQEATTEAVTDLERRSLRDMRYAGKAAGRELKRLQREIKDMREVMRTEVEADLALEPVYRAQEFMKKGMLNGEAVEGPTKMRLSEVEALYEDRPVLYVNEVKRALGFGQYGMLAKEGIHPEQIAELFGFTSADHMIQDLMLAEPFKKAVETEIDTRMLERYGDITSEKALQDAVDAAIHNDVRGRFVATEFAALSKAPGKPRVLAAAAKQLAEGAVARLKIRNLRPAQYEAAERRAAKAAAEAARKGEVASAAAEKRNQLINFYGAKASRDALTEIDRIVRYFKKFDTAGTRKNLDTGYLDQIDKLLERFDLRKSVTNRQADKRKSLVAWVERQKEQGFDPLIDEELLDEANRTPYRELTVEEMRGLRDVVKNIEHLARLKKKLLTAKDKREFADAVNDVASAIRENAYKRVEEIIGSKSWWEQVKAGTADFLAMHRKMANWAYVMDGNKTGGAVWERFIRPMNERGNFEAARRAQATKDLGALFDRLKGQDLNKRTFVPAIGKSLSLQDRLMVALNLGNEGNTQRVMDGERWEQDQLNAVLEPLTAEHWTFVQAVWDYLDSFYPEVAAKEIRVSGVAPQKVEARPFERQLADGTTVSLRGGYFPIKYDTARSSRAEADTAAEVLQQMTQGKYTSAQTRRGHTKARAEQVDRPVRKDFGVIFEHVNQVIHDLAWHEYLIDANRLLRAVEIDGAIREAHGPQVLKWLRKALEDIALGDIPSQNAFESVINYVRAGASIAAMGWNLWTSMMQPLGLTQSASRIGTKWVAKGLGRVIGDAAHIESTARWVYDRSEFMRTRALTQQREIAEIRNKVGDKSPLRKTVELAVPASVVDAVEGSYFTLMAKAQMIADLPTWIGQYEKSMEAGETEERAADLADQAVLDSQGGGQIKDLSGIQRGNALMKLWTNFYSYFNTTYNLMADRTAQLRRVGPSDLPAFAVDQLMLTALPSVLTTLLYQLVKGEDDDWDKVPSKMASDLFGYLTGLMVGLREVGAVLNPDSSYAGPAGARVFSEINKFGKQVQQGEVDEALARSGNQLAGILFHYPAGQVDRTARGLYAMEQGEAGPLAPVVGPPPKQ